MQIDTVTIINTNEKHYHFAIRQFFGGKDRTVIIQNMKPATTENPDEDKSKHTVHLLKFISMNRS